MSRDFDSPEVASRYQMGRALPAETYDLWMRELQEMLPPAPVRAVLDLGCGTGRFAGPLQALFHCPVTAVDPSPAMLDQARASGGKDISWMEGSAEAILLADDAVDLVWMSQIFHHLDDPSRAFPEIRRVLRAGGFLAIRQGTREADAEIEWRNCFPEAVAIDEPRTPSRRDILQRVAAHGMALVARQAVHQRVAGSYAELYDKVSQRAYSSLVAISDQAFGAGLGRLRAWASRQPPGRPVVEPVDLFLFTTT